MYSTSCFVNLSLSNPVSLPWLSYFHQVCILCIYVPINIYIKYWMGGVEIYFLKFYDICKFQKLELSTRGRGLRTPWPDPCQDPHMHVPTMNNIFLCPWKENILRWWRLELFFYNLMSWGMFFFVDFSIEYVYCYLFSIVNTPSKRFFF